MKKTQSFTLIEVSKIAGVAPSLIRELIENEWIQAHRAEVIDSAESFDEEDLARIQLIVDLRTDLGANDASIPLILHLIDQLYYLHEQARRHRELSRE